MCGRYNLIDSGQVRKLMDWLDIDIRIATRINIAPTAQVTVIRQNSPDKNIAVDMRWWLVPHWTKAVNTKYAMFNARMENLAKSPAFKMPYQRQRAIIPASSFIEWRSEQGKKQSYSLSAHQVSTKVNKAGLVDENLLSPISKGFSLPLTEDKNSQDDR